MKQLSASELNTMSKEDMAAMILQMQRQIIDLNEKIAVLNARHFGRSTEKLSELPGQMCAFNEAEQLTEQPFAEPSIEQVAPQPEQPQRKKKQKGKRKEDLSKLPRRVENHELSEQELTEIYGVMWYKKS